MKIIKFIWQLPQNLLGLLVILFTGARYNDISDNRSDNFWVTHKYCFGVSLGNYIIFGNSYVLEKDLRHEQGHQKQSLYLGWLYLIVIGLPSVLGNLWDRIAHKKWNRYRRWHWYYTLPWERWADLLGDVDRFN